LTSPFKARVCCVVPEGNLASKGELTPLSSDILIIQHIQKNEVVNPVVFYYGYYEVKTDKSFTS